MEVVMNLQRNAGNFDRKPIRELRLVKSSNSKMENKVEVVQKDATRFLAEFAETVALEMEKSSYCITGIHSDIVQHNKDLRFQLHALKELWRLVPPSKSRETRAIEIMDKIAASREAIKACEECIILIQRRALLLQEKLQALSLSYQH